MNLAFFDTEHTKLAVRLWTALKRIKGPQFDVIQFAQNWTYADEILVQSLQLPDQAVAQVALELMQLRELLVQQEPEKAKKLGGTIKDSQPQTATRDKAEKASPDAASPMSADAIKAHYLKGLR
jgi:hypothetical protein